MLREGIETVILTFILAFQDSILRMSLLLFIYIYICIYIIRLFIYETRYNVHLYMLSFAMGIKDKTVGF